MSIMNEEYFKKFVEDLEKRQIERDEKKKSHKKDEENWHSRELNKKYRELPGNKTVWSK